MTKQILIIDDDPDIRDIAQVAFQKFAGWRVTTAASGIEGLEKAKTESFDAILLDISMPDMDGFCVFKQLQADPVTQFIPVVLLTAKVLPRDRRLFDELGTAGTIAKPFDPVSISTEIIEILGWNQ